MVSLITISKYVYRRVSDEEKETVNQSKTKKSIEKAKKEIKTLPHFYFTLGTLPR